MIKCMGIGTRHNSLTVATVGLVLLLGGVSAGCDGDETDPKANTVDSSVDRLQQALDLHVQGDLVGARKIYVEIIQNDQQNKYAYYNLGLIDQVNGDLEAAANEYNLAIVIDANYYPALYNLGIIRESEDDFAVAISLYERAIGSNPEYARAHLKLGRLLKETGEVVRGDEEIAKAIELDPEIETAIPE